MHLGFRIALYLVLLTMLGSVGFFLAREAQPPAKRTAGLEWLRHEYQLSDTAYAEVVRMHQAYFARCDALCAELTTVPRMRVAAQRKAEPVQERRQRICQRCERTLEAHLHAVAARMDPEQGRRFLAEILPEAKRALRHRTAALLQTR